MKRYQPELLARPVQARVLTPQRPPTMGRTTTQGARPAGSAIRGPVIPKNLSPGALRFLLTLTLGLLLAASGLSAQTPTIYLGNNPAAGPACNCLNNATNGLNGQFTDTVTIRAPLGQTWTILTVANAFAADSPAPPNVPLPVVGGTILPEVSPGIYQLVVRHRDATGFNLSVSNGADELSIGNLCYYPNISLSVPDTICLTGFPVDLSANTGGVAGTGTFSINGQPATTFNAQALGAGNHLVSYTFDAGPGTPGDPTDPACTYTVSKTVTVPAELNVGANSLINVVLGPDCDAEIVPDMILEGDFPCMDDFVVTVFDQNGFPIGNVVTGAQAGFTLNVLVETVLGELVGEGQIRVFDVSPPDITCPESDNLAGIPNELQFFMGNLTNAGATFLPNNFSCFNPQVAPLSGLHYFRLDTFMVTEMDTYTIELKMNNANGGVFGLYHHNFNPFGGICQNVVRISTPAPNDQGYYLGEPNIRRIRAMLRPGIPYILLTTTFDGNATGSFEYAIFSSGDGLVEDLPAVNGEVTLPLYCSSLPQLVNNPNSTSFLGMPTIVDNCMLNPTVTFNDEFSNTGVCNTATITRTFTVTDQVGNTNQCTQLVELPPIDISDVTLPPRTVVVSCSEDYAITPTGNPHPSETGYPFVVTATGAFNVAPVYCNMLASYTDLPTVDVCEGTQSFVRRWVLFDDCDPDNLIDFDQVIVVADVTAPQVVYAPNELGPDGQPLVLPYSTVGGSCTATFQAPIPSAIDDCSPTGITILTELVTDEQVPITNPFGVVIGFDTVETVLATIPAGGNPLLTGVPVGMHRLRYTITDGCGNSAQYQRPLQVMDLTQPTASCDDLIVVGLGDGGGDLSAEFVDEGSSDNCGPVTLEVRRQFTFNPLTCNNTNPYYTDWGPMVDFYCCEVGDTVEVELLVTDLSGNTNTCSSLVALLDNTPPVCIAPTPMQVSCNNLPANFDPMDIGTLQSLFGVAAAADACTGGIIEELTPVVQMEDCGQGTILRRFSATDGAGNGPSTCQQLVTINSETNYEIKFPKDAQGICTEVEGDTVVINNFGCDNLAYYSTDQVFDVFSGACYKILRTHHIINWCEYDGYSPPVEVSRNAACDETGGLRDVWLLRRPNGQTYLDMDNNQNNNQPTAGARPTNCDGQSNPSGYWRTVQSNGYWTYLQIIKVIDDDAPVVNFDEPNPFCVLDQNACATEVSAEFTVSDDCGTDAPTVTAALDLYSDGQMDGALAVHGSYPNYQLEGNYPLGIHRFRVRVQDGCGNTAEVFIPFTVVDCQVGGLVCVENISTGLMPLPPNTDADGDGDFDAAAATVVVDPFIASLAEDCSEPYTFTLHRRENVLNGTEIPDPQAGPLVVTCDDIGFTPVRVYMWDNAYNPLAPQPDGTTGGPNWAFCEAMLQVTDNNNHCTTATIMGNIAGLITNEEDEPVANVEVMPRNDMPDYTMMTANDGLFEFDVPTNDAYWVEPHGGDDYLNGVSTLDVVLIAKHILGVQALPSPYKIIAADINRSNSVTTLDLVHLRKTILGVSNDFPDNSSWRFVNANFEFPDPANPWLEPFPEAYNLPNLQSNFSSADFIAVKIGDVNGSAVANSFQADDRALGAAYYLRTDEREFAAGDYVEATFSAAEEDDLVEGFQFTLQFDPTALELDEIEWGQIQPEHVNTQWRDEGMMTVSWNPAAGGEGLGQTELSFFTLRFRARADGRLSEFVGITSRITRAEAYGFNYELRGLGLNFAPAGASEGEFFLEQNRPNPFGDQTIIGFQTPDSGDVTLTIHDTNGRVLRVYQQYFTAGYNQFLVDAKDIPATGLLYYKLETGRYAATKKMIILDRY